MAIFTLGFNVEMLYRVKEEILGTTFAFFLTSAPSALSASVRLAEAFNDQLPNVAPLMGSNVILDGCKVKPFGFTNAWSREEAANVAGTAATEAVDELTHLRINIQSTEELLKIVINRNQIAGVPKGVVTNGRIDVAHGTAWTDLLDTWASGVIQLGGFQFFLGCASYDPPSWEVRTAARFQVNPFLGTRIDRIKNRPNTGSFQPVAPPP